MRDIGQIVLDIIDREGGFSANPADPAGPRNMGVSLTMLARHWRARGRKKAAGLSDLRALKRSDAALILLRYGFEEPGLSALPRAIHDSIFDAHIAHGTDALRQFQALLNGFGHMLALDAVLGPQTAQAALETAREAPAHFRDAWGISRRNLCYALADHTPYQRRYCRTEAGAKGGWITRAEQFVDTRYHLTNEQHRERVAKWP